MFNGITEKQYLRAKNQLAFLLQSKKAWERVVEEFERGELEYSKADKIEKAHLRELNSI